MSDHVYVSLTFRLDEQVTPTLLAQRVAEACFTRHALRHGEAVVVPDGSGMEIVATGRTQLAELGGWPPAAGAGR